MSKILNYLKIILAKVKNRSSELITNQLINKNKDHCRAK